jgi:hypothetical protein
MQNIDVSVWIPGACALFALVSGILFFYEAWEPPITPFKNTDISDNLE